jgi:glutathione S-transferase
MRTQIFGSRLSPFVEKVVRAAALKGLSYELVDVKSPLDFRRWNPQTGKMPVLEIDGERTYDSTLILRLLDVRFPEPPLVDADSGIAARQRFIEDWSDEALYWYGMALRWADVNTDATVAQVVESLPLPSFVRPLVGMIFRRQVAAQARAQGLARLPIEILLAELERRLDELLVWLADRPFFFADRPSVADLAIFGQMRMLQSGPTPQAAERIRSRPTLGAYLVRVDAATRRGGAKPVAG